MFELRQVRGNRREKVLAHHQPPLPTPTTEIRHDERSSLTDTFTGTPTSWDGGTQARAATGPLRYNGDGESHIEVEPAPAPGKMITDELSYVEFCKQNPLWTKHQGADAPEAPLFDPAEPLLVGFRGQMAPRHLAKAHPAAPLLREYATKGCPVDCGRDWTLAELESAIERGPHKGALDPLAIKYAQGEARAKASAGQCKIVKWSELKKNLPPSLKISPVAAVPHKSRMFRMILDLSFALHLSGYDLPSVNESTKYMAKEESLAQLGGVLPRIIAALAEAKPEDGPIFFSKMDIKDGFWRMICEEGAEWNFCYVLPALPGDEPEIVVPTSLQMGWTLSPAYFCTASETGRDVGQALCQTAVGTIPVHPLEDKAFGPGGTIALPDTTTWSLDEEDKFLFMLEDFIDDYIALAQTTDVEKLRHLTRGIMHGIHSVFPPPEITNDGLGDPISIKKLDQGEGLWEFRKEVLGWVFDGATRCISLPDDKREKIDDTLKSMLKRKSRVLFKDFEKVVGKLRHAAIGIPAGKGLFNDINRIIRKRPTHVWIRPGSPVRRALDRWRILLKTASSEPTHCEELVPGDPDYVMFVDASGGGAGGVIFGGKKALQPTVFRFPFPPEISCEVISDKNPTGKLTNSDLEMAAIVLGWLVLEGIDADLRHAHVGIYSDNTPSVSWTNKMASKRSNIAGHLLFALAMRQRLCRASPLCTLHIAGIINDMADIPSRSFGYKAEWNFQHDADFLNYFESSFPLPNQRSWKLFQPSSGVTTRIVAALQMKAIPMVEWQKLPPHGKSIGTNGSSSFALLTSTPMSGPTLRTNASTDLQQCSPGKFELEAWVKAKLSKLTVSAKGSRPLTRPFPWLRDETPSKSRGPTNLFLR